MRRAGQGSAHLAKGFHALGLPALESADNGSETSRPTCPADAEVQPVAMGATSRSAEAAHAAGQGERRVAHRVPWAWRALVAAAHAASSRSYGNSSPVAAVAAARAWFMQAGGGSGAREARGAGGGRWRTGRVGLEAEED